MKNAGIFKIYEEGDTVIPSKTLVAIPVELRDDIYARCAGMSEESLSAILYLSGTFLNSTDGKTSPIGFCAVFGRHDSSTYLVLHRKDDQLAVASSHRKSEFMRNHIEACRREGSDVFLNVSTVTREEWRCIELNERALREATHDAPPTTQ